MSNYYGPAHRELQDAFDSRRLADLMEGGVMHAEFAPHEVEFLQSRDMFFLASVDTAGRPTVSYKGGAPGFVRVTGPKSLVFPWFDGNGMFYSAGNIAENGKVGLLFIDFATPNRLRVQGEAKILRSPDSASQYPGAQFLIEVQVESIWVNCPRYIHPHRKLSDSKYIPDATGASPLPGWKRLDIAQEALRPEDRARVGEAGGVVDMDAYAGMVQRGEG
ncbi:pyridoxamine 5'-phosphate oxidase family protein [Methylocystis sp. ATCC 49242]|uniref:pyridoxamine 5'-phosphate oxidase family protein n=1 Tax=Methylocystis sp. ATCC 49242 TaxID=622637 RepID=UPI0001F86D0B|nr:pyridoxamine 5'-phosphate oxidase family protein [Methylocystis sp. ATCC 49242]